MHRSMFTISIILSKLPSPRGVRIASMKFFAETCGYTLLSPRGVRVASPKRARRGSRSTRCRPREGCGLHPFTPRSRRNVRTVAVPARGAGCILLSPKYRMQSGFLLPSPRGVRVASAKGYKPVSAHLSVPYNPQAQYNTRTAKNARRFVPVIQKTRV